MIMKTRNIALTLFAGVALLVTSCVNEREFSFGEVGKDEIAFIMGGVQTKAAAEDFFIEPETVETYKVGNGDKVVLEETVESLYGGPDTKGTPAFTKNVAKLYGSFNAVANPNDAAKKLADASFPFNETTNYWSHAYRNQGIWEKAPLTFYMRMPASPAGVTSSYTYNNDGSIEFDYTSPTSAAGQQDILFTSTTITDEDDNPKEVTFWHALTGIKFSNFYTNNGIEGADAITKTIIKEVTLSGRTEKGGFKNSGHCKVASDGTVTWSDLSGNASFALSVSDTTNYSGGQYGLDELLDPKASARNLNDADGSLTFWVVPQEFVDSTVMITIKCDIELVEGTKTTKTVSDTTITVNLGPRTWSAGQLHTFTLKPVIVGVELTDDMSDYVKSNARVENKGNVWEYVRVNMIANWVGNVYVGPSVGEDGYDMEDDVILMGYTTDDPNDMTEVEFWNDKDGLTHYGTFDFLTPKSTTVPAPASGVVNGWVRYDKYYYYTEPIGPNDAISAKLFGQYEVGASPEFWISDVTGTRRKAKNVHLVMDLMVQAIPAPVDADGNVLDNGDGQGYIRAWVAALDEADEPSDLLDL